MKLTLLFLIAAVAFGQLPAPDVAVRVTTKATLIDIGAQLAGPGDRISVTVRSVAADVWKITLVVAGRNIVHYVERPADRPETCPDTDKVAEGCEKYARLSTFAEGLTAVRVEGLAPSTSQQTVRVANFKAREIVEK
jgi:hypothetical protein